MKKEDEKETNNSKIQKSRRKKCKIDKKVKRKSKEF